MRIVRSADEVVEAVTAARREATSAFGDGTVFLERFVEDPRHVEVQIFGDTHGTVVHLFERECSIQRRYQKIVEEAPSPAVDEALRAKLADAAVAAGAAFGYTGAGTVEFIVEDLGGSSGGGAPWMRFFFLEVNTRLQVEHPVTEEVTGLDLVALQIQVAEGEPLPAEATGAAITGHAIEARLYAEDPAQDYLPGSGTLHRFRIPALPGVRVDTGVRDGSVVGTHCDPMPAKVIARGRSRGEAARLLARALAEAEIHGLVTNRDLLVAILRFDHPDAATNAEATAHRRITVKDSDRRKVGRAFSNTTMELALGGYPGFHTTTPPTAESAFGVYWPALVPACEVEQRVTLPDGTTRTVPHSPVTGPEPVLVEHPDPPAVGGGPPLSPDRAAALSPSGSLRVSVRASRPPPGRTRRSRAWASTCAAGSSTSR